MKVSKTAASTARRLFGLCMRHGSLDETMLRSIVARLVSDKPRDFHPILVALQRLTRLELDRRRVVVESATHLDEPSRFRIASSLAKQHGEGLSFTYQTNPALLGGLRIRVGNDVLDGSIQGRLDRLAAAF
jgi:F-type H+-transporting ATPase subunit delta